MPNRNRAKLFISGSMRKFVNTVQNRQCGKQTNADIHRHGKLFTLFSFNKHFFGGH